MIEEINFGDLTNIYNNFQYTDGEIYFADNITSFPTLTKAFKVNFFAFGFCLNGEIQLHLNGNEHTLKRFDGIFVDARTVVDLGHYTPEFRCIILGFSTGLGFNLINKSLFDAAMQIRSNPVIHFKPEEVELMLHYYGLAKFKIEHTNLNFGRETMGYIVQALLYDLLSNVSQHIENEKSNILRQGDKLFRRFVIMLADGKVRQRSVQNYAAELCVTPKYLTSICRAHAGRTAGELIAQSVVNRIKQLLLYSDLSIKEIAAEMEFDNLSFFGKYVKKHLGHSPNTFRHINGYGK